MILGRRTHHARTADIDLFNRLGHGHAVSGNRLLEGIQVADDEFERNDPVFGDCLGVIGSVGTPQDGAMDLGVQGLDPSLHDLGESGVFGDPDNGDTGLFEVSPGAPGGDDLEAEFGQLFDEGGQAGLVTDADQGPSC